MKEKKEVKNVKKKPSTKKTKEVNTKSTVKSSVKSSTKPKTEVIKETEVKVEKKKSNINIPVLIISIILCASLYILPILFIGTIVSEVLKFEANDFKVVGNKIVVGNEDFSISNMSASYDLANKSYVINGYINEIDDDLEYISIIFELYDINNYVIGETEAFISDVDDNKKYKFKAEYHDYDSKDVVRYKIKEILFY